MNQLTRLSLADAESFSLNSERGRAGSQAASPLSPAAQARMQQRGGSAHLSGVMIAATQNIKHNCCAVLSFIKGLPSWHFLGVMRKTRLILMRLFERSCSNWVPHWLSLSLQSHNTKLNVWTGIASHVVESIPRDLCPFIMLSHGLTVLCSFSAEWGWMQMKIQRTFLLR